MTILEACNEYARLICARREMDKAITMLWEMAPDEAYPILDTIKRVAEIDTALTDPTTLLLRASVS